MTAPQNHPHPTPPVNGDPRPESAARLVNRMPRVQRSRMGGLWVASVLFAVVLLLLLIFVLQNGQRAEVSFLGAHGTLPIGVALLLAAVFGVLLVALPGTARIMQLRLRQRRATGRPDAGPPPGPQSTR
ncbi:LapA family protein [Micromonospora sp. SD12]